ncbi:MAG: Ig-like domain-containing protein [Dysgonomonas sp.]
MKHLYFLLMIFFSAATVAQTSSNVTKVFQFQPAPGQFTNESIGKSSAKNNIIGSGSMVSLGGWGGYVIAGFDRPIANDPQNPYGVDFTIKGNAFTGWAEPAAVMVMKDTNGNGLPDDEWYELAGSEYYFSSTIKNLTMTYYNPKYDVRYTTPFKTDKGFNGALLSNAYHSHSYYPDPFDFGISPDSISFTGTFTKFLLDKSRKGYVTAIKIPCFGYADNHPNNNTPAVPRNPYYKDASGAQADGFDLSWAVDRDGNHVELDTINFVKVYATVQEDGGWLGEVSPEVVSITITTPVETYVPQDYYVHVIGVGPLQVLKGESFQYEGLLFKNGIPDRTSGTPAWTSSDPAVGTIDNTGLFQALELGSTKIKFSQKSGEVIDSMTIQVVEQKNVVLEIEGNSAASTDSVSMVNGETIYITAQSEDNRTAGSNRFVYETYSWTSSDPTVGTIDNGLFKSLKVGETTVYAQSTHNPLLKDSIVVTVSPVPALALINDTITLADSLRTGSLTTDKILQRIAGNKASIFLKNVTPVEDLAAANIVLNKLEYAFDDSQYGVEKMQLEVEYYNQLLTYDLYLNSPNSTVSIGKEQLSNALKVYPNPFTAGFYVNLSNTDKAQLIVAGITGQILVNRNVQQGEYIDMSNFADGQYVVKLVDTEGKTLKEVIIKK